MKPENYKAMKIILYEQTLYEFSFLSSTVWQDYPLYSIIMIKNTIKLIDDK